MKIKIIWTSTFLTLMFSCSALDPTENNTNQENADGISEVQSLDCGTGLRLADDNPLVRKKEHKPTVNTGVLKFKLSQSDINPCSVSGYVVGSETTHTIERLDADTFVVSGLTEGEHDVVLTAETFSGESADAKASAPANIAGSRLQGVRVNEVGSIAGQTVTEAVTFGSLGSIRGNVKLAGQTNHEGIEVFIPGTSYQAKTDATGSFRMQNLPPGTHDLVFQFKGYHESRVTGLSVHSGSERNVDNVVMILGAGDAQITLLGPDGQPVTGTDLKIATRQIRFSLTPTGKPKLMRISENGNFANVPYTPFKATNTYLFKPSEELSNTGQSLRRLSVELLDGETSQIIELPVTIAFYSDVVNGGVIESVSNVTGSGQRTTNATIKFNSIPELATELRYVMIHEETLGSLEYSLYKDYVDVALSSQPWLPVADEFTYDLFDTEGNFKAGNYTLIVKFRTREFIQSTYFTQTNNLQLFPRGTQQFIVKHPVLNATYKPKFELINIAQMAVDTVMQIDFRDTNGPVTFANMPISNAPVLGTSHLLTLPSSRFSCGQKVAYMKQTHVPSGIESEVFEQPIEFRCAEVIQNQDVSGKYIFSAQAANKALFFSSREEVYYPSPAEDVFGNVNYNNHKFEYNSNRVCKVFDFSIPNDANNNWRDCGIGAPSPRNSSSSVQKIIGNKLVIFGGNINSNGYFAIDGGIFDFETESWTLIPEPSDAPDYVRDNLNVIVSPSHLILTHTNDGAEIYPPWGKIYDFYTKTWSDMSFTGGPNNWPWNLEHPTDDLTSGDRYSGSGKRFVWTGNKLVVFGGYQFDAPLTSTRYYNSPPADWSENRSVYIYTPSTNSWQVYSDPAITNNYNRSDLVAINEDEIYPLGGTSELGEKRIRISISNSGISVTDFQPFDANQVISSPHYNLVNSGHLANLSINQRLMHSFEFANSLYWFGGTYYDELEPERDVFAQFHSLDLNDPTEPWKQIPSSTQSPFISSQGTYYKAMSNNRVLAVYSIVNPLNKHHHDKNLFSVYDLNETSPQWRAYPNTFNFINSVSQKSESASLIRDVPAVSFSNNKYLIYGGGYYNPDVSMIDLSLKNYDDPVDEGILLHIGKSPISIHSAYANTEGEIYVEKNQTYRLGFKITNAQIPTNSLRVYVENISNATANISEIQINQTISSNETYAVKTDGSTAYIEFVVDNGSDILMDTPVKIDLAYEGGTYAEGSEQIKGKASFEFFISVPTAKALQNTIPLYSYKDSTNRLNFDIVNTGKADISDYSIDFTSNTCINSVVSESVPSVVPVGATIPAYIDFTFNPACVERETALASFTYSSNYGGGSLSYNAVDGYYKSIVYGDDPGEQTEFPKLIPQNGTDSISFTISGAPTDLTELSSITFVMTLSHDDTGYWFSDMEFRMQSPAEAIVPTEKTLPAMSSGQTNNIMSIDSAGALASYLTENLNGTWTLTGIDTYDGDGTATIEDFIFTINYISPTP